MAVAKPASCDGNGWVLTGDVGNPEELQRALDENAALKDKISVLERFLWDQSEQTVSRVHELSLIIQAQESTIINQALQMRQMQEENLRESEIASDQIERLESKLLNAIAIKDKYHKIILSLYGDLKNDEGVFKLTDTKNKFHAIIVDLYEEIFEQIDKIRTLEGKSEEKTRLIRTLEESLKRREGLLQQFQEQQQQLELKNKELHFANRKIGTLETNNRGLNKQVRLLKSRVEEYSSLLSSSNDDKNKIAQELLKKISKYEAEIEAKEAEIEALVVQRNTDAGEIDRLKEIIEDLRYKITILETQRNSFKDTMGQLLNSGSDFREFFVKMGRILQVAAASAMNRPPPDKLLRTTREQMRLCISQTERRISDLREEIRELRKELYSAAEAGAETDSIEASLQKKKGKLLGLEVALQNYQQVPVRA